MIYKKSMAERLTDVIGTTTVCAQCGYRFVKGDGVLRINQTGDCVHKDCFPDYIDENMEEFCEEFEM